MKLCWHCMVHWNVPLWIATLAVSAAVGDFPPHPWGWMVILLGVFLTKFPSHEGKHAHE